jgi:hypothetical protein
MIGARPVAALANDFAILHHERADRHFARSRSSCGKRERLIHIFAGMG